MNHLKRLLPLEIGDSNSRLVLSLLWRKLVATLASRGVYELSQIKFGVNSSLDSIQSNEKLYHSLSSYRLDETINIRLLKG